MRSLQPNFALSAQQALSLVAPTTMVMEQKLLEALRTVAAIRAGTPAGSGEEQQSAPALPVVDVQGSRTATGLPGRAGLLDSSIGMEQMLRHTLATALFQEVQLLNRYVSDVVLHEGYQAYVVRLQVSVMPRARNEPYDVYSDIAFSVSSNTQSNAGFIPQRLDANVAFDGDMENQKNDPRSRAKRKLNPDPIVVPLLVTDSMEAAFSSRSSDVIRQYAIALSALTNSLGLSSEHERYSEEVLTTVGNDHNSLYTISRANKSVIRVRFGAMLQNVAKFSMVPQTRNVTLLLLVKRNQLNEFDHQVNVVSKTEYVDAESGKSLPFRTPEEFDSALDQRFEQHFALREISDREVRRKLLYLVSQGDFEEFSTQLEEVSQLRTRFPEQAYLILQGIVNESAFASTSFSLPSPLVAKCPEETSGTFVVAHDDLKETLSVTLKGGVEMHDLKDMKFHLQNNETAPAEWKPAGQYEVKLNGKIHPRRVQISDDGRSVELQFPSLKNFGTKNSVFDQAHFGLSVVVTSTCCSCPQTHNLAVTFPAIGDKKPTDVSLRGLTQVAVKDMKSSVNYDFEVAGGRNLSAEGSDVQISMEFRLRANASAGRIKSIKSGGKIKSTSLERNHFVISLRPGEKLVVSAEVEDVSASTQMSITASTPDTTPAPPLVVHFMTPEIPESGKLD